MDTELQAPKTLTFSTEAQYKIQILGHISHIWSEYLGGLTIISANSENNRPITILEGVVADQAELLGILNSIYEMHLPLLSVSFVEPT